MEKDPGTAKVIRLGYKVQNYAWGKLGSSSKVAQLACLDGHCIDEAKPYAEVGD